MLLDHSEYPNLTKMFWKMISADLIVKNKVDYLQFKMMIADL